MQRYRPNTAISIKDLISQFPNEESARIYLENQRWNGSITCPRCGRSDKIGRFGKKAGQHRCNACKKPFNVKTGTIFENSKIPLDKWFLAFYFIITARKGVSSMQISKELGITQKSAWFMCHRIRNAMRSKNFILNGIVECDETYIGGKLKNKRRGKESMGRGPVGKIPVFGMIERDGKSSSIVVPDTTGNTLQGIIRESVGQNSTICTDEWRSYIGLGKDYTHLKVKHKVGQFKDGLASTNSIEGTWSLLKRGYYGIFHWMSPKHLQRYADEFDFRHNEGNVRYLTMDRVNSLVSGCWNARLSWKRLVA